MKRKNAKNKGIFAVTAGVTVVLAMLLLTTIVLADSVLITSPDGGEYVSGTWTITMTNVTTNRSTDVFNLSYSLDNTTYTAIASNLTNASSLSYSWSTTGVTDDASVWIRAYKCWNNSGTWEDCVVDYSNASFYVDNTAPSVAIVNTSLGLGAGSGSARHIYTSDTTLTSVMGTCSDATAGINMVKISSTDSTNSSAYWSVSDLSLSSGCNVVTVTATDKASNSATDTMTVCRATAGTFYSGMLMDQEPSAEPTTGFPGFAISDGDETVGGTNLTKMQVGGIVIAGILAYVLYTSYSRKGATKATKKRRRRK